MSLERYIALVGQKKAAELDNAERLDPDGFPMLQGSELTASHKSVSEFIRAFGNISYGTDVRNHPAVLRLLADSEAARTGCYLALLERIFAYDAKISSEVEHRFSSFFIPSYATAVLSALLEKGLYYERVFLPTLLWFNSYRFFSSGVEPLMNVVKWRLSVNFQHKLSDEEKHGLMLVRSKLAANPYGREASLAMVSDLLGEGAWQVLDPCEVWAASAIQYLETLAPAKKDAWLNLLLHCQVAAGARPTVKWLKAAGPLLAAVGAQEFRERVLNWFPLVDDGQPRPLVSEERGAVDERFDMNSRNSDTLKGLLWLCPQVISPEVIRTMTRVAISAFRKIPGQGPRAVRVGNAAIYVLSEAGTMEAVGQLAILQARVKDGTAVKEVEKAFLALAENLKIPRDEMEEIAVPTYGLTEVGKSREIYGDFIAELKVTGSTETEISWQNAEGKRQKSVPKEVKENYSDNLKDLQNAAKDIQKMLPVQKERMDSLFLQQKQWSFNIWRERYLEHPLIGILTRRLLWDFILKDRKVTGIWYEGRMVDIDLQPLQGLHDDTQVQIWHPIGKDSAEVIGWREWLDAQQIRQPFKQAHRELYVITDAERITRVYSNRYAAHVLKQHQFNALCALRGWKNRLRLLADRESGCLPATLLLPHWGLRAEFWMETVQDNSGSDTNDSGTFLYLTTDQVKFYRINTSRPVAQQDGEPMPLTDIPQLVFSEVMRDVDMFVSVASVGNDVTWADGGPEGGYRDYWNSYSFGDLTATAKTRKEVLQKLIPRLKIAKFCSFEEKFLIVRGKVRTYKIHMGSGNILMEPNDQYLCIVAKQGVVEDNSVFLPFEGDRILSLIISKAFLLAADDKIKDQTILNQIHT